MLKPKQYLQEFGDKLDSKSVSGKFKKAFKKDADDLLDTMGRPDEPVIESHVNRVLEMMRRKWESIAAKRGKPMDEKIWESFEKGFLKDHIV